MRQNAAIAPKIQQMGPRKTKSPLNATDIMPGMRENENNVRPKPKKALPRALIGEPANNRNPRPRLANDFTGERATVIKFFPIPQIPFFNDFIGERVKFNNVLPTPLNAPPNFFGALDVFANERPKDLMAALVLFKGAPTNDNIFLINDLNPPRATFVFINNPPNSKHTRYNKKLVINIGHNTVIKTSANAPNAALTIAIPVPSITIAFERAGCFLRNSPILCNT